MLFLIDVILVKIKMLIRYECVKCNAGYFNLDLRRKECAVFFFAFFAFRLRRALCELCRIGLTHALTHLRLAIYKW